MVSGGCISFWKSSDGARVGCVASDVALVLTLKREGG